MLRSSVMASVAPFVAVVAFLYACSDLVKAFPDGAPIEACVRHTPNVPNHPATRPQPAQSLPYLVVASDYQYKPGQQVEVTISGHPFKGFFLQARDIDTNDWVKGGEFMPGSGVKVYKPCNSITHTDNKPKDGVKLLWQAPADRSGFVYFTGTVLYNYTDYWSDVIALVPNPEDS